MLSRVVIITAVLTLCTVSTVVLGTYCTAKSACPVPGCVLTDSMCPCDANTLNCGDFPTRQHAQLCLEKCGTDVHRLDGNNDGVACDSKPACIRPTPADDAAECPSTNVCPPPGCRISDELCPCGSPDKNCGDFASKELAQACLAKCAGDPHRLDNNKDGFVCVSNPACVPPDTVLEGGACGEPNQVCVEGTECLGEGAYKTCQVPSIQVTGISCDRSSSRYDFLGLILEGPQITGVQIVPLDRYLKNVVPSLVTCVNEGFMVDVVQQLADFYAATPCDNTCSMTDETCNCQDSSECYDDLPTELQDSFFTWRDACLAPT